MDCPQRLDPSGPLRVRCDPNQADGRSEPAFDDALTKLDKELLVADRGHRDLVFPPVGTSRGYFAVEWFDIASRETRTADAVDIEADGRVTFTAPFGGPAVLYVRRTSAAG